MEIIDMAGNMNNRIITLSIIFFIIGFAVTPGFSSAQIHDDWKKTYGGPSDDVGRSVLFTDDGGLIIAGYTHSFGTGKLSNIHIVKTNKNGFTEWRRTYGGEYDDQAEEIIKTEDGGYLVAGSSESYQGKAQNDFYMLKLDSDGKKQWENGFGGNYREECYSVVQTEDNGYLLVGQTVTFGKRGKDFWAVKTDDEGNELWRRTYGGDGGDVARSVTKTEDGNYLIAGSTNSFGDPGWGAYLVKIDGSGDVIWNRTAGGNFNDQVYDITQVEDGYVYVGSTTSYGAGEESFWMVKTDLEGYEEWNYSSDGNFDEVAYAVEESKVGSYVMTGYTSSYGKAGRNFWVVEISEDGEEMHKRTFGSGGDEEAYDIDISEEDEFALAGYTSSYGAGGEDFWVVKTGRKRSIPITWVVVGVVGIISLIVVGNWLNKRYRFW